MLYLFYNLPDKKTNIALRLIMKKYYLPIFLLSLFILNFCTTEPEQDNPRYTNFIIKVDKISVPDTISINDSLSINFWGLIGYDGCHQFKEFETRLIGNDLHMTLWGTKPNFETACPAVIVYLDGKEYKSTFEQIGNYEIIIHQPDNSLLIESLVVR